MKVVKGWTSLGGSESKEPACNAGDLGLIPGLGRFPGEGNDNPLQYSCLQNSMDRGTWQATVHGVAKLDTSERLTHTQTHTYQMTGGPPGYPELLSNLATRWSYSQPLPLI